MGCLLEARSARLRNNRLGMLQAFLAQKQEEREAKAEAKGASDAARKGTAFGCAIGLVIVWALTPMVSAQTFNHGIC